MGGGKGVLPGGACNVEFGHHFLQQAEGGVLPGGACDVEFGYHGLQLTDGDVAIRLDHRNNLSSKLIA